MKKLFLIFLLSYVPLASSCNGYVFGFKGKDDVFDQQAFDMYVEHLGYCGNSYSWYQVKDVRAQISNITAPYHLYGFSQGAVSVGNLLSLNIKKPEYVLTIGAYKTTNVNFDRYQVKYKNYFDHSGLGQTSPGVFLNVPHNRVQREVNRIMNIGGSSGLR